MLIIKSRKEQYKFGSIKSKTWNTSSREKKGQNEPMKRKEEQRAVNESQKEWRKGKKIFFVEFFFMICHLIYYLSWIERETEGETDNESNWVANCRLLYYFIYMFAIQNSLLTFLPTFIRYMSFDGSSFIVSHNIKTRERKRIRERQIDR